MLRAIAHAIKTLFAREGREPFEITPERRRMMIDFQRSDYYND
jgi:hypothetical protein